jgi:hypothetical protein
LGGIGDKLEDFVEKGHQHGIRDKRQTWNIKNWEAMQRSKFATLVAVTILKLLRSFKMSISQRRENSSVWKVEGKAVRMRLNESRRKNATQNVTQTGIGTILLQSIATSDVPIEYCYWYHL